MPFCKSHIIYLKEKYYSILSELEHIYRVLDYYGEKSVSSHIESDAKRDIEYLKMKLSEHYRHKKYGIKALEELCGDIDTNNVKKFNFFVYIDVQQEQIEKILVYMERLQAKITQYLSENMVQHLPQPLLSKRYSSRVLSDIIDKHTQALFNFVVDPEGSKKNKEINNFLSCWSHYDIYKVTTLSSLPYEKNSFIGSHSFYYHDLIWTIPSLIDHEVILSALPYNEKINEKIDIYAQIIVSKMLESIHNFDDSLIDHIKNEYGYFFDLDNIKNFLFELYAGWIAFSIHGNAYKYAFYHETLSSYFGRDFWSDEKEKIANDYIFIENAKRDFLLCRQILTLRFGEVTSSSGFIESNLHNNEYFRWVQAFYDGINGDGEQFSELASKLEKAKEAIEKKEGLDGIKKSLMEALHKIQSNIIIAHFEYALDLQTDKSPKPTIEIIEKIISRIKTYMLYNEVFSIFISSVSETIDSESIGNLIMSHKAKQNFKKTVAKQLFFREQDKSVKNIVEDIWKERFNLIHGDRIPHRSILRKKLLEDSVTLKEAYVMRQKRYYQKRLEAKQDVYLGYFDEIRLEKRESTVQIEDFDQSIENLFDKPDKNTQEPYFEIKHALIEVDLGHSDQIAEAKKNATMEAVVFIYMEDASNTKKNNKLIEEIGKAENIQIYKSLGSEDFVCRFWANQEEQKQIWEAADQIKALEGVSDTFMSIVLRPLDGEVLYPIDDAIWIKQLYKMKNPMQMQDFRENISNACEWKGKPWNQALYKNKQLQIFNTEGGYDFELWWNVRDFSYILKTYNALYKEIDVVTSFVEIYIDEN